jgi:hypothetical protein
MCVTLIMRLKLWGYKVEEKSLSRKCESLGVLQAYGPRRPDRRKILLCRIFSWRWKIEIQKVFTAILRAKTTQSVGRLATGRTTEGSEFESLEGQEFSLLQVLQTGSGTYRVSYPMYTGGGGVSSGVKRA